MNKSESNEAFNTILTILADKLTAEEIQEVVNSICKIAKQGGC